MSDADREVEQVEAETPNAEVEAETPYADAGTETPYAGTETSYADVDPETSYEDGATDGPAYEEVSATSAVGEGQLATAPAVPLRPGLEALLMVVDEPVAEITLAQVLERPVPEVEAELRALAASYDEEGRGFELRRVAGGWRFYTRAECAPVVERFVRDGQQARLTHAALETLAVVAYRQPVSRARVSAVRGVNVDGVMRTLVARGLVEEAGSEHESGATLYRTTTYFLERLGLDSLDQLPELAPFLPDLDALDELTEAGR